MKEYNGMKSRDYRKHVQKGTLHMLFSKLIVNFETFICPMIYKPRNDIKVKLFKLT